jgi:outer membrane protein assembly factor BamB
MVTVALAILLVTLSLTEPFRSPVPPALQAASTTQAPAFPSGPLVLRVFTAHFHPDGSFTIEGTIEGMGTLRVGGKWKAASGTIELVGYETPTGPDRPASNILEKTQTPMEGCDKAGRYLYEISGPYVRFTVVGDDCMPRRTLLDRTSWGPPGVPEAVPVRHIARTAATPAPALPSAADPAGSWPSFRGPHASGVADGQDLPDRWSGETREQVLWRTAIPGLAHSSPIVWDDRLFVTSAISTRGNATFKPGQYGSGDASDDRSRQRWMLYALDRRTGEILWERTAHESEPIDKRHIKSTYASSTPATDGRVVVAWFGSQGVHAYTVEGAFLWKVDLGRIEVGPWDAPMLEWGPASSPIIWNDLVILQVDTQADSFLIALAVKTGEEVWKTAREEQASWSTPTLAVTTAGAELIAGGANYIRGYDPRTGRERWRLRSGTLGPIPTPVAADGLMVVASSNLGPARPIFVVRPGAVGDLTLKDGETSSSSVVWSRANRAPFTPTPVVYRGLLYVLGNNGVLDAYDVKTGEEIYRQRLPEIGSGFSASPVAADGKLYLSNEDGQIIVVAAGREFRHIATNPMGELMMATPALSKGVMYLRGARSVFAIGTKRRS